LGISTNSGALNALNTLFRIGATREMTDGQLLEHVKARRAGAAEPAFAALVERHGPVVLAVCRSVLRNEHDAQDAFQATFLVLVHKAASLRVDDSLGPWLHTVAFRVARGARAAAVRRERHERRRAERSPEWVDGGGGPGTDLAPLLHEEIDRLPERLRAPVVLCDLEGRTHLQAARDLGWPVGTVKSRQSRGRERLRARLARRGVVPSAGLAAVLATDAARAAVPAALANGTVHVAIGAAAQAGAVPAQVAALMKGALKAMSMNRLRRAVLLLALTGGSAAGAWLSAVPAPAGPSPSPAPSPRAVARADDAVRENPGKIYYATELGFVGQDGARCSIVAVDPKTGDRTVALDGCSIRPRLSPEGRSVAYVRGDALWVSRLAGGGEPKKILELEGRFGQPVWSGDGKQIIMSLGKRTDDDTAWTHKTVRVNADGTGRTELTIPAEDNVQDWSADGRWLLTASSRNAEIGWQLYVMRPDGTEQRQLTEGGNPFYARFSPDGRRLLYADGTTEERRGIWVVGFDGKDRRRVIATGRALASACWSPDGKRIAVLIYDRPEAGEEASGRLVVMDSDGSNQTGFPLPGRENADMPDWR
jgi:RNA polymerase sigma factor (sigma-70 family)